MIVMEAALAAVGKPPKNSVSKVTKETKDHEKRKDVNIRPRMDNTEFEDLTKLVKRKSLRRPKI